MLGYIAVDNINPTHTNTDLHNYWQAYFVNDDWKVTPRLTVTLGLRYDYFQRYKQSDDKFVNIYLNGFVVSGRVYAEDLALRPRVDRAGPQQLRPARRLCVAPASAGRNSGSRRLRHVLHAANLECDFCDGGRCAGHRGRHCHRQYRRRAERILQQPVRPGVDRRARCTSRSATIRTCATATSSNGTSTCSTSCRAISCWMWAMSAPRERLVRYLSPI